MKFPKPKKRCKNCAQIIETPLKDASKPGIGNFCSHQCFVAHGRTTAPSAKPKSLFDKQMEKPGFRKKFKAAQKILNKEIQRFNLTGGIASPKPILDRDPQYREFVRAFPCIVCRTKEAVHAHHVDTGGLGVKGSDYSSIPLCHSHHTGGDVSIHKLGPDQFQQIHGIKLDRVQILLLRAYVRALCGEQP